MSTDEQDAPERWSDGLSHGVVVLLLLLISGVASSLFSSMTPWWLGFALTVMTWGPAIYVTYDWIAIQVHSMPEGEEDPW